MKKYKISMPVTLIIESEDEAPLSKSLERKLMQIFTQRILIGCSSKVINEQLASSNSKLKIKYSLTLAKDVVIADITEAPNSPPSPQ